MLYQEVWNLACNTIYVILRQTVKRNGQTDKNTFTCAAQPARPLTRSADCCFAKEQKNNRLISENNTVYTYITGWNSLIIDWCCYSVVWNIVKLFTVLRPDGWVIGWNCNPIFSTTADLIDKRRHPCSVELPDDVCSFHSTDQMRRRNSDYRFSYRPSVST